MLTFLFSSSVCHCFSSCMDLSLGLVHQLCSHIQVQTMDHSIIEWEVYVYVYTYGVLHILQETTLHPNVRLCVLSLSLSLSLSIALYLYTITCIYIYNHIYIICVYMLVYVYNNV